MAGKSILLDRDTFREAVFARDNHACVFCKKTAAETPEGKLDAHHIIERRLFTAPGEEGGYFLDNGASVCESHHLECEMTTISVEEVRETAGITKTVIPAFFYEDQVYTKWGDIVLPNGTRSKGPLFHDESVQKVLARASLLDRYVKYVKHPRLPHLPWSPGVNDDDRIIESLESLIGKEVVVTEKLDGEQSTIYNDYYHARSIDGPSHESRNWLKAHASRWQYQLADDERVCGENLYAQHSIVYGEDNPLASYFMGFSLWKGDLCLGWDDTLEYFEILGVTPVPVLWRGVWNEKLIRDLYDPTKRDLCEGYVVRLASSFRYGEFKRSVAKFVREGHVQTAKHHWRSQRVIQNSVAGDPRP